MINIELILSHFFKFKVFEIAEGTNIFIDKIDKVRADDQKDPCRLARSYVRAIFTPEALLTCSLTNRVYNFTAANAEEKYFFLNPRAYNAILG